MILVGDIVKTEIEQAYNLIHITWRPTFSYYEGPLTPEWKGRESSHDVSHFQGSASRFVSSCKSYE